MFGTNRYTCSLSRSVSGMRSIQLRSINSRLASSLSIVFDLCEHATRAMTRTRDVRMRTAYPIILVAACGAKPAPVAPMLPPAAQATTTWRIPAGWKHEVIAFPLEFAPSLAHRGVEELRFPPGFLDDGANHWSYAFVWRLDDDAALTAEQLG